MTYDARDRLITTTFDKLTAPFTFSYAPLDNLRTYVTPGRNYTHQYNATTWRLSGIVDQTTASQYTYAYAGTAGARGNVTTRTKLSAPAVTHSYTFDQANRLRQLSGPTPQTYRYDGLGRRTRITSGGIPRDQIYSQAGQLLYDKVGATGNQTKTRYLYLGRHLVAKGVQPPSGAEVITYLHTDGLGSPIAETNTAGTLVNPQRTLHEPYGLVVWGTVNQGPGYTGHVTDLASGLNYMQQRYYDPLAGRFLSVDPVEANASTGASFNRYAYANNNPYKFVDPNGEAGKVAWIVRLGADSMRRIARVTHEEAVKARMNGQNVLGKTERVSEKIEMDAFGGDGLMRHKGHDLDNGSVGLSHFQTKGEFGHTFWRSLSVGALSVAGALDKAADAAEYLPEPPRPATLEDGARINRVIGAINNATGAAIPNVIIQEAKMPNLDGFKGVFNVNGRIDASKLDEELK